MNVHQETDQFTCGFNVEFFVDHSLEANVKEIQFFVSEVKKIQEKLGAADVPSEDKSAFHFRVILFVRGVVEVCLGDAFVWGNSVDTFDGIIDFEELFFMIEGEIEDRDHFEEFLQWVEFLGEELETLNHHNFVFEFFANDHISDGGGNKLFVELFLVFLCGEEFLEILHLMS